eukprot:TRINITY_DN17332_c0_g1_i2.p1 TRINITY_DN17332_c0_g1~~TRINITY_DN17332_c0_g1_i2.p1  ORF type:complete len:692 (+),score=176.60 TRINITY_DN17332_c0_g1_i2:116-2191(+)
MIRRPPRSTLSSSSAASDVYKRQVSTQSTGRCEWAMEASAAHLRLCPALRTHPAPTHVSLDENQKLLIVVDETHDYYSLPVSSASVLSPRKTEERSIALPVALGYNSSEPCLGARLSITHRFLAIQRSNTMVEIVVLSDPGRTAQLSCRTDKRDNRILGFLWCGVSYSDIVLITTQGLEFHKDIDVNGATRPGKTYDLKCNWYVHAPEAGLILCSTGTHGNIIYGYQITAKEIVKLPKFEVDIGGQVALAQADLKLCRVYTKLMCLHLDRTRKRLLIFEVQPKQVTKRYAINLHSHENVAVSVVDNLIVVHNLGSKVSMLFDVHSKEDFPISAPLPMLDEVEAELSSELYSENWDFLTPNYVMDRRLGIFWEIVLDMEAVAQSCGNDMVALLDFLMRRTGSKPLLLKWIHKLIINQTRLVAMARIFLTVNQTLHDSLKEAQKSAEEAAAKKSRWSLFGDDSKDDSLLPFESPFETAIARRAAGNVSAPPAFEEKLDRYVADRLVVDQDRDMFKCVFALSVVDKCSSQYLTSIVAEYMRTLNHFRLAITPNITCFLVSLIANSQRYFQLHQFIQYKVIHDSEAVAEQLLQLRYQHHASFQLAVDMLQRLKLSDRIVQVLLAEGRVLDALLYTRRHNLRQLNVRAFLEHALASENEVVMFTVFRYFRNQREYEELRPVFEERMQELVDMDDEC